MILEPLILFRKTLARVRRDTKLKSILSLFPSSSPQKTCCSSLSILLALSLPLTRGALDLLPTPWPKTSSLENLISAAPAENALRQHQGITSSQINWSINTRTPQWASYSTHPWYPNREKEGLLSFWLGFEVVHEITWSPCYDWGQGGQEDYYHHQPQRWWRAIWNVDNTFSSVEQSSNRSIFSSLACLGLRLEGEFNRSTIKSTQIMNSYFGIPRRSTRHKGQRDMH